MVQPLRRVPLLPPVRLHFQLPEQPALSHWLLVLLLQLSHWLPLLLVLLHFHLLLGYTHSAAGFQ